MDLRHAGRKLEDVPVSDSRKNVALQWRQSNRVRTGVWQNVRKCRDALVGHPVAPFAGACLTRMARSALATRRVIVAVMKRVCPGTNQVGSSKMSGSQILVSCVGYRQPLQPEKPLQSSLPSSPGPGFGSGCIRHPRLYGLVDVIHRALPSSRKEQRHKL